MNKDLQEHFYKLLKPQFNRCLEPTLQCQEKAIRAHSIQNSHVLDLLCCEGHVVQLQCHFENNKFPDIRYKPVGRNKASTFTGLCSQHDSEIFKEIDNSNIDTGNSLHLFLLAYRSIYRELYATMDSAIVSQSGYQKRVELGLDPKNDYSQAGSEAIDVLVRSWRTYRYKCIFDDINAKSDYGKVHSFIRTIDTTCPTIAASVLFGIRPYTNHDDIEGITLNIFPYEQTKTLVVMSYHEEHEQLAKNCFAQLFSAKGDYFNYLVSKLLIKHGENFVISPAYYDTWGQEKSSTISRLYSRTMFDDVYDEESEHLNLFQ